MSYHRFPNLRELFQGDLNKKLLQDVVSKDFQMLPCNCRNKMSCPYNGKCRTSIVIYQACCLTTGKKYIGNMQQHVKTRIQQHVQDTKRLVLSDKKSDSFANHFAKLVPEGTEKKDIKNFIKVKVEILWKGNPLSCVKTFGTKHCKLCSKERMAILNLTRKHPEMAINKCNEVYGACRHRPRFHRFKKVQNNASTDESDKDERVNRPSSTTSMESTHSFASTDSFTDKRECDVLSPPIRNQGYIKNMINGLQTRSQWNLSDEPQVESNLEELPQEHGDLMLVEQFEWI